MLCGGGGDILLGCTDLTEKYNLMLGVVIYVCSSSRCQYSYFDAFKLEDAIARGFDVPVEEN